MNPSHLSWYALQVPPLAEFKVEDALKERGYTVFCPHEYKWRRVSRYVKRQKKKYPLLARYVFIGFEGSPSWRTIERLDGVRGIARLVGTEGQALKLPTPEVMHLMRLCQEPGGRTSQNPHKGLKIGDVVRVVYGPLSGYNGELAAIKNATRARVFLDGLDKMGSIEIPLDALEAA